MAFLAKKKEISGLPLRLLVLADTKHQPVKPSVAQSSEVRSRKALGPFLDHGPRIGGNRCGAHAVVRTPLMDDVFRRTRFRGCYRFG